MRFKALSLGLAAVLAVSCSDQPTSPTALNTSAVDPQFAMNQVVEMVTGSGSFVAPEGDWRTFSFTARRHADGSVSGQWERIRRQDGNAADSKSHGEVLCFTIVDNQAFIGGRALTGLFSDPPNNEGAWRVVDNGQGANADPDQMSLEFVGAVPGFADNYCATTPASPSLNDIEAGNIKVMVE